MKNITVIIKKEFAKFFGDKRLFFTACIMPGLMIYIIYSFMGGALGSFVADSMFLLTDDQTDGPKVFCSNIPESQKEYFSIKGIVVKEIPLNEAGAVKAGIAEKEVYLYVVFPPDFDKLTAEYDAPTAQEPPPNIEIYYNSSETKSASAYGQMGALLYEYERSIASKFDVNRMASGADPALEDIYNLATSKDKSGSILSTMIPLLLIIFLYSGCLAVAPESIAGEKERGTIATLLVTQIKRSELAIGKILSLMVIALLCGLSSSLGMLLSIPKLGAGLIDMNMDFYTATDYSLLIVVILSTILVLISVLTNISAFAKTVKEAMTIANPLMIVVMLAGVSSFMSVNTNAVYYLIPIYNSVQCIGSILAFKCDLLNVGVTVGANLVYSALGVVLLSKMFNSERIVFNR